MSKKLLAFLLWYEYMKFKSTFFFILWQFHGSKLLCFRMCLSDIKIIHFRIHQCMLVDKHEYLWCKSIHCLCFLILNIGRFWVQLIGLLQVYIPKINFYTFKEYFMVIAYLQNNNYSFGIESWCTIIQFMF